ncbi:PQQ-like beta-propeller repeat protein [bacterium]|nr:PQQ-like beta-propeller repeat protein [bacterium]
MLNKENAVRPRTPLLFSFIAIVFLQVFTFVNQSEAENWMRTYTIGIDGYDQAESMKRTSDNGFVISGLTNSNELFIMKLDSAGALQLHKTISMGPGSGFTRIAQTLDGGYLLTSQIPSGSFPMVAKINKVGEIAWQRRFNFNTGRIHSATATPDGAYILGGVNRLNDVLGAWIVKLDADGTILWEKFLEGILSIHTGTIVGTVLSVDVTNDGNVVLVGHRGNGGWICKITLSGSVLWERSFEWSEQAIELPLLIGSSDGGVIVAGQFQTGQNHLDIVIAKLNSSGVLLWQKTLGGKQTEYVKALDETPDGGIVLGGTTGSFGAISTDPWLVKLSSTGAFKWSRIFASSGDPGAITAAAAVDSGVAIAGSFGQPPLLFVSKVEVNGDSCFASTVKPTVRNASFAFGSLSNEFVNFPSSSQNSTFSAICSTVTIQQLCGPAAATPLLSSSESCTTNPLEFVFPPAGTQDRKVLITNYGSSLYPEPTYQTENGKINIVSRVTDVAGAGVEGVDVFFRILDPADGSLYVTNGQDGDNNGGDAEFDGLEHTPGIWKATSQAGGYIYMTLQLPTFGNNSSQPRSYSGDNFKIEASFNNQFSCSPGCVQSGMLTAWKRIYLEHDMMYRKGGLLFYDFDPATCGNLCNQVVLYDWSFGQLQDWDQVVIFDVTDPVGELATVAPGGITNNGNGTITVTFTSDLVKPHFASSPQILGTMPDFANGQSAGLGVISSGFYAGDFGNLSQTFDDGYAEVQLSNDNLLPTMPEVFFEGCIINVLRFHQTWFSKKQPGPITIPAGSSCGNPAPVQCGDCGNQKQNNWHIIPASSGGNYNGYTHKASDDTFIFLDTIDANVSYYCTNVPSACDGTQLANHIKRTTNHELSHQFGVNQAGIAPCPPSTDGQNYGHDENFSWCGNSQVGNFGSCRPAFPLCGNEEWCVMNQFVDPSNIWQSFCQRTDGIDRLDCSDLIGIDCPGVFRNCAGNPPTFSVRGDNDPE